MLELRAHRAVRTGTESIFVVDSPMNGEKRGKKKKGRMEIGMPEMMNE